MLATNTRVTVRDIQYIGSFGRGKRQWGRQRGVPGTRRRPATHLDSSEALSGSSSVDEDDGQRVLAPHSPPISPTGVFSDTPFTSKSRLLTDGIVAINTAVFVLQVAFANQLHLTELGVNVHAFVDEGEIWRLLTSIFLHGSVVHLLLNNISLHALGALTEWTAGKRRFVAIYLLSGIGGNVCSYAMTSGTSEEQIASLGASGAIFGLAGALLVFFWRNQVCVYSHRLCGSKDRLPPSVSPSLPPSVSPSVSPSLALGGRIQSGAVQRQDGPEWNILEVALDCGAELCDQ